MLEDVEAHRPTEIELITGALVREAERHGVEVPLHTALYRLVKAKEASLLVRICSRRLRRGRLAVRGEPRAARRRRGVGVRPGAGARRRDQRERPAALRRRRGRSATRARRPTPPSCRRATSASSRRRRCTPRARSPRPRTRSRTAAVCTVQNGVGNEEVLAAHVERVIRGTTFPAGRIVEPGHVQWDVKGDTTIGPFEPKPGADRRDRAARRRVHARRHADERRSRTRGARSGAR